MIDTNESLKVAREKFFAAKSEVSSIAQQVEKSIQSLLQDKLRKYSLFSNINYFLHYAVGVFADNWDPQILISHVRFSDKCYIPLGTSWVLTKRFHGLYARHLNFSEKLGGDELTRLVSFLEELRAESPVPVNIKEYSILSDVGLHEVPKNVQQVRDIHTGCVVVAQGTKGEDPWVILRSRKGKYIVWYSTNGCGLGYDKCTMPAHSKEDFIAWLGSSITPEVSALLCAT